MFRGLPKAPDSANQFQFRDETIVGQKRSNRTAGIKNGAFLRTLVPHGERNHFVAIPKYAFQDRLASAQNARGCGTACQGIEPIHGRVLHDA
jgi:hypothetical protein